MKRSLASLASKCQCAALPWLCRMEPSRGGCSAGAQLPERRRHRAPLRSGTGAHRGIPGTAPPPEAPGQLPHAAAPPGHASAGRREEEEEENGARGSAQSRRRRRAGSVPGGHGEPPLALGGRRRPVRCGGCTGGVRGCAGPLCKASWRGLARAAAAGRLRTARSGAGFCVRSGLLRRGAPGAGAHREPAPGLGAPSPCGSHVLGARGQLRVWDLTPGSRQRGGSAPNPR